MNTIADFRNKYDEDLEPFELKRVDLHNKVLTYRQWLYLKDGSADAPFAVDVDVHPNSTFIDCDWKYYLSELQYGIIRIKVWTDEGFEEYEEYKD